MRKSLRAIMATTAVLAFFHDPPPPACAGELTHRVGRGESLSLICRNAYGDKDLYELVALYNGKEDPTRLNLGEVLRLPYSDMVTLGRGDSLSSLAKRVWGNPKLYTVLAWANGVKDSARIEAGTRLAVPVLVPYRLKSGESVSSVAGRFYGNPKVYEVIMDASGIENPSRLSPGTVLKVPYVIPRPRVKARPVTGSASKPRVTRDPSVPGRKGERAAAMLEKAEAAFRDGRYGEAWTMAHDASRDLSGPVKASAFRLMAASHYAFGKTAEALDDLRTAHALDPDFRPDPAYVNPEMMTLYEKAGSR